MVDALNRFSFISSYETEGDISRKYLFDCYYDNKLDGNTFPLTYQKIDTYQWKYHELVDKLKRTSYHTKYFCGGVIVIELICKGKKTFMTEILQKYVVNWYHTYLIHPVMDCTEVTIIQN